MTTLRVDQPCFTTVSTERPRDQELLDVAKQDIL